MFAVTRFFFLAASLLAGGAQATDSNFYIAFPLGFNQVSSEDVRIVNGAEVPGGFRGGLRLGVNIKGYAGLEFNVDAQGWDIFKEERGGLGFVGGALRLHPVQIAQRWKPELKDRDWDISMAYGNGWHLLGQQADGGSGRAYEGSYHQFELAFEYYVTEIFAVALELPWRNPVYDPHVFSNYEDGRGFCFEDRSLTGRQGSSTSVAGTCEGKAAPQASIFSPAVSLNFRIPLTRSAKRRRGPAREY